MKRTPLCRKTPLKRRTPLRRRNPERAAKRFEEAYGIRGDPVRAMACLAVWAGDCDGPIEAAHATSRGASGTRRHLVPLCRQHHRSQHRMGPKDFRARYHINLKNEAARIAVYLDSLGIP